MSSVTVVLVSFRTGPILFRSVSSLLSQSQVGQLIIVDNGNPIADLEFLQQQFGSDPRFEILTGHGNVGFARGCNLGVKRATRDYVLLLNPDCILPEGSLEQMLASAVGLKGKWLLGPLLVNPDNSEQQGGRREILTPWLTLVEGLKLYKLAPRHPYFKRFGHHHLPRPEQVAEVPVASGACMLLSRDNYWSVGGMDESYFLHVEDIDFCLRFRKSGGKIYFCPKTSVVHTLGTSDVPHTFVEWHKLKGLKRYFRHHFQGLYPPGFVGLVNLLLVNRFLLGACSELLTLPLKPFLNHRRRLAAQEMAAGQAHFSFVDASRKTVESATPGLRTSDSFASDR